VAALPPVGDHAMVKGAVPPVILTEAEPVAPPLHNTFVVAFAVATGLATLETLVVAVF